MDAILHRLFLIAWSGFLILTETSEKSSVFSHILSIKKTEMQKSALMKRVYKLQS